MDGTLVKKGEGIVKEVNPRGNPLVECDGKDFWVILFGPISDLYSKDYCKFITRSASLSELNTGDRFLYQSKLLIKTDKVDSLATHVDDGNGLKRVSSWENHHYCVEFYSGKLVLLVASTSVVRSN